MADDLLYQGLEEAIANFDPEGLLGLDGGPDLLADTWANMMDKEEGRAATEAGKDGAVTAEAEKEGRKRTQQVKCARGQIKNTRKNRYL